MAKMIEVDEEAWNRNEQVRKTVAAMMQKPESRKLVLQAEKALNPDTRNELDVEKVADEKVAAALKRVEDLEARLAKEKDEDKKKKDETDANSRIEAGRRFLRSEQWTDDGIKKLEEFMIERNIGDYEAAAAYWEKQHPPAPPATPSGSTSWNFIDPTDESDAVIKKLVEHRGNNDRLTDSMAQQALAEFRAGMLRR